MSTSRLATTLVVAVVFFCAVSCQMAPASKAAPAGAPVANAHLAKSTIPAAASPTVTPAAAAVAPAAAMPPVAAATSLHSSPEVYMIFGIFLVVGFGLVMALVKANRPIDGSA